MGRSGKIILKQFALACGALLLIVTGCAEPGPTSAPSPRAVETFEVQLNNGVSAPVYAGTLRAQQRSDLSFLRTGQVIALNKDLGEAFSKGEILARLDNTELSLAVDELTANLLGAEADLRDAQISSDRLQSLDGTGAVSRADYDGAKARMMSIEASIGQARKRLSDTVLRAPYDGQIVERLVEPSQTAAAGQPVYRVIGNDGGMEAIVNLPVSALNLFVEGYETEIQIQPSGARRLATVTEVGNAAGVSGLYPITLALADPGGLRPGLRVEVPGRRNADVEQMPSIPLTAYLPSPGDGGLVFLVDRASGRISVREVTLGAITDDGIEVISGLGVGDLIVARGLPSLRDGEIVTPLGIGVQQFND